MIRVLIADDHPIVRQGLRLIISSAEGIDVTGDVSSAAEVNAFLASNAVEVLVLDVSMPGRTGLDLLHELKRQYPKLPVLILSQFPEEQIGVRAIRAGAAGYINKESAPGVLVDAIRHVHRGRKYLSPNLAELLAVTIETGGGKPHETLSDREFLVLKMIGSGKTVSAIAAEHNLSVKTISTYRARILEKMNLKTNADLTLYAIKNGIVE
jgi:DNA-binding NarL/FixJ family response regulator